MPATDAHGALPYPTFPAPGTPLTADAVLADFARCAEADGVRVEVPPALATQLRAALERQSRDGQRGPVVASLFGGLFREVNAALAARGDRAAWTSLAVAEPGGGQSVRWYRLTEDERRACEAAGAIATDTMLRRLAVRFAAAVGFYVLLGLSWSRRSAALYAATAAALALYYALGRLLPTRPRLPDARHPRGRSS